MTNEERDFYKGCMVFKKYNSLDEYIDDIRKCLMLSDWQYSERQANERIKVNRSAIKADYANKEPAWDSAMEAGYCCG